MAKHTGIKRLPNGKWQARVQVPDGKGGRKQVARNFATVSEARVWREAQRTDVLRGEWVDPRSGAKTFQERATRWLESQTFNASSREATEQRLSIHAYPHFGATPLRDIRPSMLTAWIKGKMATHASAHVLVMVVNVSQVLGAAVDDGEIQTNPAQAPSVKAAVKRLRAMTTKRVTVWDPETVMAVVDHVIPAYRAVPLVAFGCGLRQGEVLGLQLGDIDFLGVGGDGPTLHVRRQVKRMGGKLQLAGPKGAKGEMGRWSRQRGEDVWITGDKERAVPLPGFVADALAERIATFRVQGPDALIFTNRDGRMVDRSPFNQYQWKPAVEAAGLESSREHGLHVLRHTYASVLLSEGESPAAVSAWLGHANVSTTLDLYAHVMPNAADQGRATMDGVYRRADERFRTG